MYSRVLQFLIVTIILCGCGTTREVKCPNGEPVIIPKKIGVEHKEIARKFSLRVKRTTNLLNEGEFEGSLGTRVTKLRDDLNNSTIRYNSLLNTASQSFHSRPCDTVVRNEYLNLVSDLRMDLVSLAKLEDEFQQLSGENVNEDELEE